MGMWRDGFVLEGKHLHVDTILILAFQHLPQSIEELFVGKSVIFVKIREGAET